MLQECFLSAVHMSCVSIAFRKIHISTWTINYIGSRIGFPSSLRGQQPHGAIVFAGRVMLARGQGKLIFYTLRGAGAELQIICAAEYLPHASRRKHQIAERNLTLY